MDPAHRKARTLAAAGDYAGADPWFLNALARNPGDLPLIVDFTEAVQAAAAARQSTAPQVAQRQLEWLADFVERLGPDQVLHRVTGEAPPEKLLAPQWELHKTAVRDRLTRTLEARGTRQGSLASA